MAPLSRMESCARARGSGHARDGAVEEIVGLGACITALQRGAGARAVEAETVATLTPNRTVALQGILGAVRPGKNWHRPWRPRAELRYQCSSSFTKRAIDVTRPALNSTMNSVGTPFPRWPA